MSITDHLNRDKIAVKISTIITSGKSISPLVINGPWGSGKTILCKLIERKLKEKYSDSFHVVYIDSFEEEISDEPLISLLAAIKSICPDGAKNRFQKKLFRLQSW